MKLDFEISNIVSMIFDKLEEKIGEIGGIETLKNAAVWDWWKNHEIHNERDFDSALQECYESYLKIQEYKEQLKFKIEMEALDEDPTNIPS